MLDHIDNQFTQSSTGRALAMVVCICASLLLVGCEFDPLGIEKLRKESQSWRELAQIQAQAAIQSIPGERLLQIYDGINSADPKKVRETQELLKRMGRLDPSIEWDATVVFGFNEAAHS
jgi:hypothetical protein